MFVVISIATAYNEFEVSNLQTAVDMCLCVFNYILKFLDINTILLNHVYVFAKKHISFTQNCTQKNARELASTVDWNAWKMNLLFVLKRKVLSFFYFFHLLDLDLFA